MRNELIKLANHLDKIGLYREASYLDSMIEGLATQLPKTVKSVTGAAGAIQALRQKESFSYPIMEKEYLALQKVSNEQGFIYTPSMSLSSTGDLILGIAGIVAILVLVAMALGYNVSIRGKKDKASGEIIFNSPDSPEEEETEEGEDDKRIN
jgi:hypothetical protein